MQCTFVGPANLVPDAIPFPGSPHPEFPTMICSGYEVISMQALLAEVRVNYVGQFQAEQSLVSTSTHEGSISWTTYVSDVDKILTPQYYGTQYYGLNGSQSRTVLVPAVISKGYLSVSYLCRYIVQSVTVKSFSRSPSSGLAFGGGGSVLSQTVYVTGASLSDNHVGLVTASLAFDYLGDTQSNDLGNGWFEISVTSTPRPYIASSAFTT